MRHKIVTNNGLLPKCATSGLKAFRITRSQAKICLYSEPEARCTSSSSFFYRGGTSRGHAMEDGRESDEEAGVGDGKHKRVAITEKTQAGNMMGFHSLPPGTKAAAAPPPPPGQKATTQAQSDYQNSPRAAYDATAPALVQMVPEICEQAAESELSGRFRGVLAITRGMVTGSRANSSTSGASIWASLLSQSASSSSAAKRASRAWGRMTEDGTLAGLFHDPAARAAGPPRHDAAAVEFKVSTTTLNRLLVWAWAMAGTTQPDEETQANTTARIQFRLLAHRAKDYTTRYADILTQAAENAATPSATPRPTEPETPAYGGPPKAPQSLLERHQSPPQPATLTQTQGKSSQTATTAGGQREPGRSFITAGPSTSADASKTAGTTGAQPPKATDNTSQFVVVVEHHDPTVVASENRTRPADDAPD